MKRETNPIPDKYLDNEQAARFLKRKRVAEAPGLKLVS
jgi:hypothetical protein